MEKSVSLMELENRMATMSLVSRFDVNGIGIQALLFQTGYLTITEEQEDDFDNLFRLDYPNLEVRISLNRGLLGYLGITGSDSLDQGRALRALLEANDFERFGEQLRSCLSNIPYQWHARGDLARYEAWYASLFHMCLRVIGVDLRVEDASSHGSAVMVVLTGGRVFVLNFTMADENSDTADALDAAIAQMRERNHARKYRDRGEPVHLVGVACRHEARNRLKIKAPPDAGLNLDFIEWQVVQSLAVGCDLLDLLRKRLQRLAMQPKMIHFHRGYPSCINPVVQEFVDQVLDQNGLSCPARPQQHHGASQSGLQQRLQDRLRIGVRTHHERPLIHFIGMPPRVQALTLHCKMLIRAC